MIFIKSADNNTVKHINGLKKRSYREKTGEFLLEGVRAVHDSAENGAQLTAVLVREGYDGFIPDCDKQYEVEAKLFEKLTDTENSQGIIASAKMKTANLSDLSGGVVVICDNVRDPGNVGTVIRTAHAVGAAGIVFMKGSADPFAPKTVRATMGSVFKVPITFCDSADDLLKLRKNGYKIAAGALTDKSVSLFDADLSGQWAIVVGNEGDGVSESVLSVCDSIIKIPMPGGVESLNASVACSLMLYEHLRRNK